jgi:hypothetical protein
MGCFVRYIGLWLPIGNPWLIIWVETEQNIFDLFSGTPIILSLNHKMKTPSMSFQ